MPLRATMAPLLAPLLCALQLLVVTLLLPHGPLASVAEAHLPFSEPERLRNFNWGADSWAGGTEDEDFSMASPSDILAASVDCAGGPRLRDSISVAVLLSTPDDVGAHLWPPPLLTCRQTPPQITEISLTSAEESFQASRSRD